MHRYSPSKSPARKRQRTELFSPTYDSQLPELSLEDFEACDEIEARFSQPSSSAAPVPRNSGRADDTDNLFSSSTTAAKLPGFASAATFRPSSEDIARDSASSLSFEAPPEQDYSAWFEPAQDYPAVGFQTAKFAAASSLSQDAPIGFMKASNKGRIEPSSAALAKAKEKMKAIWAEDSEPVATETQGGRENAFRTASTVPRLASPERPALRSLDNSFNSPGTPSPAQFSRPSSSTALPALSLPGLGQFKAPQAKPFKSPLLPQTAAKAPFASSPLNPHARPGLSSFVTAGTQHPFAAPPVVGSTPATPLRASTSAFVTPMRGAGNTARTRATFVTPFKAGMKPGEPGRWLLEEKAKVKAVEVHAPTSVKQPPQAAATRPSHQAFFDLTPRTDRKTLLSSGLVPQKYTTEHLETMGVAASELMQITPTTAMYYSFHEPSSALWPNALNVLGPAEALEELLRRGCSLATKPWVDNHWALVLWKLAGMAGLEPEREGDPQTKRWCWDEVIRQLLYRYERELNKGVRPPLRCIAAQDAPASCPMVLCVSNITWSEPDVTDDGIPLPSHPEFEVTDGWYRLRARVDAPLARAARRGLIQVGRKIGVVGAQLSTERKEASEVLEAYNSTMLVLSGNSSHLVPWHAKLGFQSAPWVSTMNSLTPDGGLVAAMDLVVLKTYPIGFLEWVEGENGEKQKEGPRNERDEAEAEEKWKRRREVHESKLREEFAKKEVRYQGYAERLERRAGAFAPAVDAEPPDEIEDMYEELEDPAGAAAVFSRVDSSKAGWLARFIVARAEKERERSREEIEQELRTACPPREVRNFRVLVVQDACTRRKGANRSAQLTVWDAAGLPIEIGGRYSITKLTPTAHSSWMDRGVGSEIYLTAHGRAVRRM